MATLIKSLPINAEARYNQKKLKEIHQIVFQDSNVTKIAAIAAYDDTKVGETATANGDDITEICDIKNKYVMKRRY